MVAVDTLVKPQYKPPIRVTTDSKGVTCELWEIPDHSRYYLVRREGKWDIYDRLEKHPITRYTDRQPRYGKNYQYYKYRLVSDQGKIHQQGEHWLVMSCLSLEQPQNYIRWLNGNTLDNRIENLQYWSKKLFHMIRDTRTGEIHAGNGCEIRNSARIRYQKVRDLLAGKEVANWELVKRDGYGYE